jgi:hypothetical protein
MITQQKMESSVAPGIVRVMKRAMNTEPQPTRKGAPGKSLGVCVGPFVMGASDICAVSFDTLN